MLNMFGMESDNDEIDVGMNDLVKDESCLECDYKDAVNKEVVEQDPDPDAVVEADLEMDPAAATEAYIKERFGLSKEDLDNTNEFVKNDAEKLNEEEDEEGDESCESLDQSSEKFMGYFKRADFKNNSSDKNHQKKIKVDNPKEFLNSELGKSRIKLLIADAKKKGYVPATLDEINNLKPTFFQKYIRGIANDSAGSSTMELLNNTKYYKVDGVIFATWVYVSILGAQRLFHAVGMFKNEKTNKITSIIYAQNVQIINSTKLSEESIDYTNFVC